MPRLTDAVLIRRLLNRSRVQIATGTEGSGDRVCAKLRRGLRSRARHPTRAGAACGDAAQRGNLHRGGLPGRREEAARVLSRPGPCSREYEPLRRVRSRAPPGLTVTDAATHDSQLLAEVLDEANTGASVWADSAYRSEETEQRLGEAGFKSQVHYKGQRSKPLSAHKRHLNRLRSTVRARVEHVFGFQQNSMGGKLIRTIGLARAKTKIALMNLTYNIRRYLHLERRKPRNPLAQTI